MNKITIKDIAKMLNVSISTVSRALADHPDIGNETKARVKEVAEKFKYTPNLHARFFRKKNTKLIALIIPEFNRFFTPDLIKGIQKIIDDKEYSLIIFQSKNDVAIEEEIIKYCLSWVVEGVLIALTDNSMDTSHLKILKDSNIPVVMLDKVLYTDDFSTVTINDKEAAYVATNAILTKNRKNIVGIFGHENLSITKNRLSGFKKALEESGLHLNDKNHYLFNSLNDLRSKFNDIDFINSIDGLFIMTDELLVNSLSSFLKLNKSIPEDLSVVAFSDGSAPYFLYPNISHIFHSGFLVGQTACEVLFELIANNNEVDVQHKVVGTNLIDLGSI